MIEPLRDDLMVQQQLPEEKNKAKLAAVKLAGYDVKLILDKEEVYE